MDRLTVLVWVSWLLAVVISFGVLEAMALNTHRWETLSHFVWEVSAAFPLINVVYGMIFGGLAVHFFWTNQGLQNMVKSMVSVVYRMF
jgi:hypothetical protein